MSPIRSPAWQLTDITQGRLLSGSSGTYSRSIWVTRKQSSYFDFSRRLLEGKVLTLPLPRRVTRWHIQENLYKLDFITSNIVEFITFPNAICPEVWNTGICVHWNGGAPKPINFKLVCAKIGKNNWFAYLRSWSPGKTILPVWENSCFLTVSFNTETTPDFPSYLYNFGTEHQTPVIQAVGIF